jgi:hypothetical protein
MNRFKNLYLLVIFGCLARCRGMENNNALALCNFLTMAPQLIVENVQSHFKPYEMELGLIAGYFEEHTKNNGTVNNIPDAVYKLFERLEYNHKIPVMRLIAFHINPLTNTKSNGEKYKEVKERLKQSIQKTTHLNVFVNSKGLQENRLEQLLLLPLGREKRLKNQRVLTSMLRRGINIENEEWWKKEENEYCECLNRELQEKYDLSPSVYKGSRLYKLDRVIFEDIDPTSAFYTPSYIYPYSDIPYAFVVTLPFSLIPSSKDEYMTKLSERIDTIFEDEAAIKFD